MANFKQDKRGMVLITTFMVAMVVFVFSGAYITGALVQSNAAQRQKASLQSFYLAEKGIEYAYIEAKNHGWNWITHDVAAAPDYGLTVKNPPPSSALFPSSSPFDAEGNYIAYSSSSATVRVKAYSDPDPGHTNEIIVLSQATSGSYTRLLKFRISQRSLYRYFYYYPTSHTFGSSPTFDGGWAGGIYVNGNIILSNPNLKNITELSTNALGIISVANSKYLAPYRLDDSAKIPGVESVNRGGAAPFPSLISPHIYSSTNLYAWWGSADIWPPAAWRKVDSHFYSSGKINNVDLPRTLDTNWSWEKYSYSYPDYTPPSGEQSVRFYDANGTLAPQSYWDSLESDYGASYFDPDFWQDKTYKTNYPAKTTVEVNYFNSAAQAEAWKNWLAGKTYKDINNQDQPLDNVINEKSTGGYDINIPDIQASYSQLAKAQGLYIGADGAWLNGNAVSLAELSAWLNPGVQFFNTVRPHCNTSTGSCTSANHNATKEKIIQLDVGTMRSASAGWESFNNIVYVDYIDVDNNTAADYNGVRLVNATELPAGGLTVVSPVNVYIKGDYNTQNWQPSAVITSSLIYALSNNFADPQDLPATLSSRESPYETNYLSQLTKFSNSTDWADTDKLAALEAECKKFFGLNNGFTIGNVTSAADVQSRISSYYNTQYEAQKPNTVASNTTMNVALTSPYFCLSDEAEIYALERWAGGKTLTIKGAFIKLYESWAAKNDVPSIYNYKRTGGPNDKGVNPDPMQNWYTGVILGSPRLFFVYEERFADSSKRPSGDFFAGSQPRWQELSATSENFNQHSS